MRIIVTHTSPDWDGISSIWFIKKFLPGWEDAEVRFVPAGTKMESKLKYVSKDNDPVEKLGDDEVIHVDTGLGPLDHHQTSDMAVSAVSLSFDFVKEKSPMLKSKSDRERVRLDALERISEFVVALDHFQEVFWPDPASDTYEFGFFGILEGYKVEYPNQDGKYVEFGMVLLDAMMHRMEERIWAERELKQKGNEFKTRFGKALAIETINDDTMKLAQKMGYVIAVRKDPRKGYIRIKAMPRKAGSPKNEKDIDLTLVKEQLYKMDPRATWFLHVSRKMLLNGTPKNPKMIPTSLSLDQIVKVVEGV